MEAHGGGWRIPATATGRGFDVEADTVNGAFTGVWSGIKFELPPRPTPLPRVRAIALESRPVSVRATSLRSHSPFAMEGPAELAGTGVPMDRPVVLGERVRVVVDRGTYEPMEVTSVDAASQVVRFRSVDVVTFTAD